jgi:hydroxymethylbilane synthase
LRLLRPDLRFEAIRGNVDTRLRKLHNGEFQAILLAAAGLERLGLQHEIAEIFAPEQLCPAPGQGALGIQTRVNDEAEAICAQLNHEPTSQAVRAERAVLAGLGGGCQLPVGAYAVVTGEFLSLASVVVMAEQAAAIRSHIEGRAQDAEELGRAVAADLLAQGAGCVR